MKTWLIAAALLAAGSASCAPSRCSSSAPVLPRDVLRDDLDRQHWLTSTGEILWPPNGGFAATPVDEVLPPGTLIDRFGEDGGRYFSPAGEAYGSRALPYICLQQSYTVFRVAAPLPVLAGRAAAWFDQPGGGTQFETDASAKRLIHDSVIVAIERDAAGHPAADRPCDPKR